MNSEFLTFVFGLFGTVIGGAVTWGVTKTKIEALIDNVQHIQDWREKHEKWANDQNTNMIERATENKIRIESLERQMAIVEKRQYKQSE